MKRLSPTAVPCNGCTLCCERDAVFLHPEHGDDPTAFETIEATHPLTGKRGLMLKRGDDGVSCFYLEKGVGCRTYANRPAMCREFDCRALFLSTNNRQRSQLAAKGYVDPKVFRRGRDLLRRGK